jgi:hyperosmotically inducible periplasmic protein
MKGTAMRHAVTLATVLIATAAALALAACGQPNGSTTGNDTETSSAQRAAADIRAAASAAAEKARQIAGTEATAVAEAARDMSISAKVSAELAKDQQLSATSIQVDTKDGRVELSGSAPSVIARDRAETIASQVDGVVAVENHLTVASAT